MTTTEQIAHLRKLMSEREAQTTAAHGGNAKAAVRAWDKAGMKLASAAINYMPAILDHLEQMERERDAIAADLWCAEDQWGDDYLWKKWGLSKNLTGELKYRLMKRANNKEGNQ